MRWASANSRHGSLTGQSAQIRRATSTPTPSLGKNSAGGLSLQVPIFSSGLRSNKVKQSNLTLQQTEVNRAYTEQNLLAATEERSEKARSALQSYTTEKQNLELAKRIFDRTSIKFTNGLSTSFELNQDQSQYLRSQEMYIGKLVDLLLARTDLRKALDLY